MSSKSKRGLGRGIEALFIENNETNLNKSINNNMRFIAESMWILHSITRSHET